MKTKWGERFTLRVIITFVWCMVWLYFANAWLAFLIVPLYWQVYWKEDLTK